MLRLAFDFIIAWREIRARPNAYILLIITNSRLELSNQPTLVVQSDNFRRLIGQLQPASYM